MSRRVVFALVTGLAVVIGAGAVVPPRAAEAETPQPNLVAGVRALEARDFEAAVRQLERAIVADPKSSEAYFRLGQSHRGLGDLDRALKYMRLALQIEPNNFPALSERGDTLLAAGKVEEARAALADLESRCGETCPESQSLQKAIDAHKE